VCRLDDLQPAERAEGAHAIRVTDVIDMSTRGHRQEQITGWPQNADGSRKEVQKKGICSKACPEKITSALLRRNGMRYGLRMTTSTFRPGFDIDAGNMAVVLA
jgi:hypothetical protein